MRNPHFRNLRSSSAEYMYIKIFICSAIITAFNRPQIESKFRTDVHCSACKASQNVIHSASALLIIMSYFKAFYLQIRHVESQFTLLANFIQISSNILSVNWLVLVYSTITLTINTCTHYAHAGLVKCLKHWKPTRLLFAI